eukprot:scaffold1954_cov268-Pinguiococcus_pyrenoidosus.AAC.231
MRTTPFQGWKVTCKPSRTFVMVCASPVSPGLEALRNAKPTSTGLEPLGFLFPMHMVCSPVSSTFSTNEPSSWPEFWAVKSWSARKKSARKENLPTLTTAAHASHLVKLPGRRTRAHDGDVNVLELQRGKRLQDLKVAVARVPLLQREDEAFPLLRHHGHARAPHPAHPNQRKSGVQRRTRPHLGARSTTRDASAALRARGRDKEAWQRQGKRTINFKILKLLLPKSLTKLFTYENNIKISNNKSC